MLNFKTQKYIFQIQKLVKMVNHTVRVTVKAMVKMKMEVTKMEVKARISTTATNPMHRMVSTIWMTHQEIAVVPEMPMATEVEDITVRQGEIMEHQEAKIIHQIVVQIEIQNTEITKMVMALQPDRLHEKVPTEITRMELIQVR